MNFRMLSAVLLSVCLASFVSAEEQAKQSEWNINAECQMIIVPQKIALRLIPELNDEGKFDAAWARVQQMIGKEEIEVLASLHLTGKAGERAVCETIEEIRYPTEFDPPQVPDKIPEENAVEALKAWPITGATPTAYETRNVGHTLELETFVSEDGNWLDIEVTPQHIRFLRWVKFDAGRLANGEQLTIEQPYFHTMKNVLKLRLRNGQRILIGVHRMPEPERKAFELFVLYVKATKPGAPESR